ncbi:peptide/nickel transport system permease protein [Neobacillus niacini]|uniref:ABC transporter permease n=1 Tax=Neobacillus niacini TaxID=86668 RepID=UPI0028591A20|nr:ABC transporter permease [Neobacillus niacini]MDR7079400.1 peptide/nickel transport system permease protein [Neobacillus niacini]
MFTYILRRIFIFIPVLIGITIINFFIINLAPGSPIDMYLDPNATAESIEAEEEALGLNDPLYVQYFRWLGLILQGDLGYSMSSFEPVSQLIGERIMPTVTLGITSIVVALIIAIPMGVISAVKQNSKFDYFVTGFSFLGISIPNFFLGLALIYIFAVNLNLLPTGGMTTLGGDAGLWVRTLHIILPTIVLATAIAGRKVRYVRASMLDVLNQDYLRTARAKGVHEFWVTNKHALRNALIPIITIVGLEIPLLFGGAIITEQIFQWPGIGQLTLQSILSRDYPTIMAINLIAAVVVLFCNLLTDILYSIADPRIKYN